MDAFLNKAFRDVPRRNFLPPALASQADLDSALPIGFGQTNSQPSTVIMMLEWLGVEPGQKILDVGSGSGWTTALLAYLTGKQGRVVAVEIIPELVKFGRDNAESLGIKNAEFHQAGDKYGWPIKAPYDRILVSAAAMTVPPELINQLAPGGCLVIPVQNSILVIGRDDTGQISQIEHRGFTFVPLV